MNGRRVWVSFLQIKDKKRGRWRHGALALALNDGGNSEGAVPPGDSVNLLLTSLSKFFG